MQVLVISPHSDCSHYSDTWRVFSYHKQRSEEWQKLAPEFFANQAINEEIEAGVEDHEDMVEAIHTEPDGRDGVVARLDAQGHPGIVVKKDIFHT